MSFAVLTLLAASAASGPVYGTASRNMPALRSSATYSRAGDAPLPKLPKLAGEPSQSGVPLQDNAAHSARIETTDLYCAWPQRGCAFVVDDPQLGRIIVRTPPLPGAGPEILPPLLFPDAPDSLAPGLQRLPRTRRSVPREHTR